MHIMCPHIIDHDGWIGLMIPAALGNQQRCQMQRQLRKLEL